jgi:mannosyltransferase
VSDRRAHAVVVGLLILGAGLRLYGLDTQSLWNDELSSLVRSSHASLAQVIDEGVRPDAHPPGFQALLYFVIRFFGDSASILRFPSAVAGTLAIGVMYLLGRALYSSMEGLVAAALLAVSWAPVYYSQEGRAYSLLLLGSLFTTYLWLIMLRRPDRGYWALFGTAGAYAITAAVTAYLHYFGLYLVSWQALGTVLFRPWRNRRMAIVVVMAYGLVVLLYAPWIPSLIAQFQKPRWPTDWITRPSPTALVEYFQFLFNGSRSLALLALASYAWLALQSGCLLWRARATRSIPESTSSALTSPALLLTAWLIMPCAVIYVASVLAAPMFVFKYLIICLPPAYLLLARGVARIPARPSVRVAIALALVGGVLYHLVVRHGYYVVPTKEQFREAVRYVAERTADVDDSVIIGYAWSRKYFDYYFVKCGSNRRVDMSAGEKTDIDTVRNLLLARSPEHLWFIRGHREPDPEFLDFLQRNLTLKHHERFIGADVWLFQR